jgi:hypothetical protein
MKTPVPRDRTSELLARFKKVYDDAADSVPLPTLSGHHTDPHGYYREVQRDPDAPAWVKADAEKFLDYHKRRPTVINAAIVTAFTREELKAVVLAYQTATGKDRQRGDVPAPVELEN